MFGSGLREKLLLYLEECGEAYSLELAKNFGASLFAVQSQLKRLEEGGILVSKSVGKTRMYSINPRYFLKKELISLLKKNLEAFRKRGRHRRHPVGGACVSIYTLNAYQSLKTRLGKMPVKMLSPTDCIKDRLCGYFYWNDLQCLEQAAMVAGAREKDVDVEELKRWARQEGMLERFATFENASGSKGRGER